MQMLLLSASRLAAMARHLVAKPDLLQIHSKSILNIQLRLLDLASRSTSSGRVLFKALDPTKKMMQRQSLSMTRQIAHTRFRIFKERKPRGFVYEVHKHEEGQLLFTVSGTIQVVTDQGRWLVPPQLAVWIPAGILHSGEVLAEADMWWVLYHPSANSRWAKSTCLQRPFALRRTPLLVELINSLFASNDTGEREQLIVDLILHELVEIPNAPTYLPMPTSAAGKRVADVALSDPGGRHDIDKIAAAAATSARTISRTFPEETGLTFKAWRQRARIVAAIDRLASGHSISSVAEYVGFSSTSSFACAFRQVTGYTVSQFTSGKLQTPFDHRP